jgi:SAM-dependent methyltransferase
VSHPEQLEFIRIAYGLLPEHLVNGKVLEIGSYDVNGSTRNTFDGASEYVGVDIVAGPGVDMVCFGHEISLPEKTFKVSLSVNCFEHDEYWVETFRNMIRLTSAGGVVIFTCASTGFPEHGTRRSEPSLSPGTQSAGLDYYRNLTAAHFYSHFNLDEFFTQYRFWYLKNSCDLYLLDKLKVSQLMFLNLSFPLTKISLPSTS